MSGTASFVDVMNSLVTILQGDNVLTDFCLETWGKAPTVRKVYRKRTEINLDDLPIVLITRPVVTKKTLTQARDSKHDVRFYCGFQEDDAEKGPDYLVRFEEFLDDVLTANPTILGTVGNMILGESANDEGALHPIYFFVAEAEVHHRRSAP